ncbi:hypothetical protein L1887_60779 [Cichorium endivia]|nr:hypothetical protein L1887_60779 [Cichorium endivia]
MSKRKRTSASANGSEDDEREECNSSRSSGSGGEEADDVKNVETRDGEEPDVADVTTHIDTKESEPRYEVRAIWTAKDPRVWSFEEYPDPTSRDDLARGTRRFRYLGPFHHLSWQDLNDMAHEVAHFIWQTYSDMNPLELTGRGSAPAQTTACARVTTLLVQSMCSALEGATRSKPTSFQVFSTSRTSTGQSAWPCCTTGVLLSATLVAGWSHATSSGTALNAATVSTDALARQPARKSCKSRQACLTSKADIPPSRDQ